MRRHVGLPALRTPGSPPAADRRWNAGAWLTLLIAAGWFVVNVASSVWSLYSPSDGWTYRRVAVGGLSIVNFRFHPSPSPLQAGDTVLAVNGQIIDALNTQAPIPPGTPAGTVAMYTIERRGERLDVPVTLVAPGAAAFGATVSIRLADAWRDIAVAGLGFAISLVAFLLRPGNLGAGYLLLTYSYYFSVQVFGFTVSELYRQLLPVPLLLLYGLIGGGWVWFFFPSIALIALSVPVVKWPLRRFPRLLPAALYGLPLAGAILIFGPWATPTGPLGTVIFIAVIAVAVLSLAGSLIHNWLTLREPATRAQLRWVTLGLALGLFAPFALLLAGMVLAGVFPANDVWAWLMLALPVCLAIAITRYRLWDIDVIIRRTLIYSVLTGLLALAYFGSILLLQPLFGRLTGNTQSPLVTVLSTLAAAALFFPLRGRVQAFIDRRFYRRKYDAAQTLAAFADAARDETNLGQLTERLVGVVTETVQPQSVGLWLRKDKPA